MNSREKIVIVQYRNALTYVDSVLDWLLKSGELPQGYHADQVTRIKDYCNEVRLYDDIDIDINTGEGDEEVVLHVFSGDVS